MPLSTIPSIPADSVGWINTEQMIEIDRIMIEDLNILLIQMMENAGRNLARVVIETLAPTTAVVYAGSGGNGGGGLVCARHLHNAGMAVEVVLSVDPDRMTEIPAHQLDIVRRMGIPVFPASGGVRSADVAVDAMVGYSLQGPLKGDAARLAQGLHTVSGRIVSLDAPTGLNTSTGRADGPVVNADATVTLSLPKLGLSGSPHIGDLYLADISVPASVAESVSGVAAPPFRQGAVLQLV